MIIDPYKKRVEELENRTHSIGMSLLNEKARRIDDRYFFFMNVAVTALMLAIGKGLDRNWHACVTLMIASGFSFAAMRSNKKERKKLNDEIDEFAKSAPYLNGGRS